MIVLKIAGLILWLLVVPFCMGLLFMPLLEKHLRTPGVALVAGYILVFSALELVGIPVVLLVVYHGFTIFTICFSLVLILCSLAGIGVTIRNYQKGHELNLDGIFDFLESSLEEKILFALFLLVVGFQLYMAFTRASFDGDDAYYGVQALIAQQLDTLYRVNPYTGRSAPLDVRHALALFPIWEAYIGRMCGVHATIICHSVVPLVLIPLTYMLYWQIGKSLFGKKKEMVPMFMTLIALWQMFGNISIYTTETFFLTRTWQGKSFAGNFVVPAVIWIFLCLFTRKKKRDGELLEMRRRQRRPSWGEESRKKGLWILLACLNLAGGASSSLAILLSSLMTAGFALLFAIGERKPGILVKAGLSCVSGGVYVLLYLALTHGIIVP